MKKRFLSVFLAILMVGTAVPGFAEHVSFTTSSYSSITEGSDAYNDAVYQYLQEKFDFDMELYQLTWDSGAEKNRMWIASGTMPDFTFWADFNYSEYLSYIDQGLIKALPDGWETKYPNLAAAVEATGIADMIKVDGKTYCLPKVTHYVFSPLEVSIAPRTTYYRKDWAEQLGINIGATCTVDQLLEYVRAVMKMDPVGNGETIGITSSSANFIHDLMNLNNPYYNAFKKEDGQYVWGPTIEGTADALVQLQDIYEEGLLDRDFYLYSDSDAMNVFASGRAAVFSYVSQVDAVRATIERFEEASDTPIDGWDYVGTTLLVNDDGKWTGTSGANFWASSLFNPGISDATLDTILSLMDYLCTVEGQELISLGIPEKDWTVDENGEYVILREPREDGSYESILNIYPSTNFFYTLIVLVDSFAFVNPTIDVRTRNASISAYENAFAGNVYAYNPEIDFYTSDVKEQYSVNIDATMVQIVMDPASDAQAAWDVMIDENRAMWEPLLNEYNEIFSE